MGSPGLGPNGPFLWALEGPRALEGPLPWALEGPFPWALEEPLPWALWGPLQVRKKDGDGGGNGVERRQKNMGFTTGSGLLR